MTKRILIFGTGDFAQIAHFYVENDTPHEVVAHTVTAEAFREEDCMGVPVVPFEEATLKYPPGDHEIVIGIAYSRVNKNRAEVFRLAKGAGFTVYTYVCSKATIWPD